MDKMRTFKNFCGCVLNFEDTLTREQIDKKLSMFGGNWIEVNEKGEQIENEN